MSRVAKKETAVTEAQPVKRYPSTFDDFDRFIESVFPRFWPMQFDRRRAAGMKMPKVDIIDGKDEVRLVCEVPGVKKEDLDVSMTDHTVTIKGKTSYRDEKKDEDFYRCEIEQGDVKEGDVKATFEDGMLELRIPKLEQAKRHTIKIE
jgi:HSP20 family protein